MNILGGLAILFGIATLAFAPMMDDGDERITAWAIMMAVVGFLALMYGVMLVTGV